MSDHQCLSQFPDSRTEQGENQESKRMHYYQTQVPDSKKNSHTQKKETKHRNKTKHDLAFPGTLRGFLGEKEIRLEGGPMIFIVVQAVDFHFGFLPPEGGVSRPKDLPTIKRICLNPPVVRFLLRNSPPLKKTEIRHLWRIYVFF